MKFLMRCANNKNIVGFIECEECLLFDVVDEQASPFDLEYLHVPGKGAKWIKHITRNTGGWFTFAVKGDNLLDVSIVYTED